MIRLAWSNSASEPNESDAELLPPAVTTASVAKSVQSTCQAPFTASLNAFPAVNLTVFAAAIWISAPVRVPHGSAATRRVEAPAFQRGDIVVSMFLNALLKQRDYVGCFHRCFVGFRYVALAVQVYLSLLS